MGEPNPMSIVIPVLEEEAASGTPRRSFRFLSERKREEGKTELDIESEGKAQSRSPENVWEFLDKKSAIAWAALRARELVKEGELVTGRPLTQTDDYSDSRVYPTREAAALAW